MKTAIIFFVLFVITSCIGFREVSIPLESLLCVGQVSTTSRDKVANETQFLLFTRNNRNDARIVSADFSAPLDTFSENRENLFVVHGFGDNGLLPWILDMKKALLDREDVNVWSVNWQILAAGSYPEAVGNVRNVGLRLADFIQFLQTKGSTLDKVHLIGHSLGAQVVSYAGAALHGQVARLSAMDAAGPLFEPSLPECRLDKSDAIFVDAMHTDMGTILLGDQGMVSPVGHVDFYFNGGSRQPGCDDGNNFVTDALDLETFPACSHQRAHDLYIETIRNPTALIGYQCSNYEEFALGRCRRCDGRKCALPGYNADTASEGIFHVATRYNSPYTGKTLFATIKLCASQLPAKGRVYMDLIDSSSNTRDTTDVIYKTTMLTPSLTISVPAVVLPNLTNIDSGSLTFFQDAIPIPVLAISSPAVTTPLCVQSIKLVDYETNHQLCYQRLLYIGSNQTMPITFQQCT